MQTYVCFTPVSVLRPCVPVSSSQSSPRLFFAALSQLEDTLTNEGAPPGLTSLIKGLIKNYKLDDSLQQGAKYIESPGDRNAAASAGREALEYLALTAEYFPVVVDDR